VSTHPAEGSDDRTSFWVLDGEASAVEVDYWIDLDMGAIVGVAVPFASRNEIKQNRTEEKSRQSGSLMLGVAKRDIL
jgi:hypothetical protein